MSRTVISPPRRKPHLGVRELWTYRELLYFLVWRDVKVRYRQSVLGVVWAVLQPICMMIIFTLVLGRVVRLSSVGLPYPLFSFAALVPWMLFAGVVSNAAGSLVTSTAMITKVYFPRLLLPLSSAGAYLLDYAIATALTFVLVAWYGTKIHLQVLLLPAFAALVLIASLGLGTWFAAVNARYRDVRHALPLVTQALLFLTPIAYSVTLVPERWRIVYGLNPMAGAVDGSRWAVLGTQFHTGMLLESVASATLLFVTGAYYFVIAERTLVDVI